MSWLETLKKAVSGRPDVAEPDVAEPLVAGSEAPGTDAHHLGLVDRVLDQHTGYFTDIDGMRKTEAWGAIAELDRQQQAALVLALSRLQATVTPEQLVPGKSGRKRALSREQILGALLRKKLPFDVDDVAVVISGVLPAESWNVSHLGGVVRLAKSTGAPVPDVVRHALVLMLDRLPQEIHDTAFFKHVKTAEALASIVAADVLPPDMPWARAAAAARQKHGAWDAVYVHATSSNAGKPSTKWLKTARELLEPLGADAFAAGLGAIVDGVQLPNLEARPQQAWDPGPWQLPERDLSILKGLAWFAGLTNRPDVARELTRLAIASNRKVPGHGARALRVSNACIWALGNMPGLDAVGQLAVLRVRIKSKTAQKIIGKAFVTAAEREGLPAAEIEEMAVPAYGLTEPGRRVEQLGDFRCELVITGTSKAELRWFKPDGSRQKSVPAAVKRDFADELKALKAAAKDVDRMVSAQKARLDGLVLKREPWRFDVWRERYLDHPVVGALARRLIWAVDDTAAIWADGGLRSLDGTSLDPAESAPVRLWHPMEQDPETVLAWRARLAQLEVVQPFKQAWREIYVLTPAEDTTEFHSNRFAAHIVRQHAMNALATARGWSVTLHLLVDQEFPSPHKLLPEWGLRAEFWVDGAGDDYGTDTNDTGVYHYLATDSVRFYPLDSAVAGHSHFGSRYTNAASEPIPLRDVPPLVVSEVFRDVDLFVGVCSVGNDPEWQNGGRRPQWATYWSDYAFGTLSTSAKVRKEVLATLLPKLAIRDKVSIDGNFVQVQGTRHRYQIHIGSGNIQILPARRYLCIVPGGKPKASNVYLPFEGDRTLSIILSKALMLVKDDKIKDATILAQL